MTHLHKNTGTRKVYLRNNDEKMHFVISREFDMNEVRKIVEDEFPSAKPVLMLVDSDWIEPEKEVA